MANQPKMNNPNKGLIYSNLFGPANVELVFTVNHTDTGGLGITGLKSNGYAQAVFMNTNQSPGVANGITNPNPAAGYALIYLANNYNAFIGMRANVISPNSGSDVKIDNSAMTAGQPYVITTLGNATLAKWQAIGVPVGVVPAVGVAFIAASNGGAGNTLTSRVQTPGFSGISSVEVVGKTHLTTNSQIYSNSGWYAIVQFVASAGGVLTMNSYTPAGTITNGTPDTFAGTPAVLTGSVAAGAAAATAPTDGSIIQMTLMFDKSSATVDGL